MKCNRIIWVSSVFILLTLAAARQGLAQVRNHVSTARVGQSSVRLGDSAASRDFQRYSYGLGTSAAATPSTMGYIDRHRTTANLSSASYQLRRPSTPSAVGGYNTPLASPTASTIRRYNSPAAMAAPQTPPRNYASTYQQANTSTTAGRLSLSSIRNSPAGLSRNQLTATAPPALPSTPRIPSTPNLAIPSIPTGPAGSTLPSIPGPTSAAAPAGGQVTMPAMSRLNEKTEALKQHDQPIASLVPTSPGSFRDAMQAGDDAFRQGSYQQAIRRYNQAVMLEGKSADARLALALATMTNPGSYSVAAVHLANSTELYPELVRARIDIPGLYGENRSEDWEDHYNDLALRTRRVPGDADARLLLGYVSYVSGRWEQAIEHLQAVQRLRGALLDEREQLQDARLKAANLLAQAAEAQRAAGEKQ
ncbi:MAG: hypothetical protein ACOCZE_04250 [Planctomycetota bacterium]